MPFNAGDSEPDTMMNNQTTVNSLEYALTYNEHVNYDAAPRLERSYDEFTVAIDNKSAIFTFTNGITEADAKSQAEQLLQSWQISSSLKYNSLKYSPDEINYRFEKVKFNQGDTTVTHTTSRAYLFADAHIVANRASYPELPESCGLSLDADTMFHRNTMFSRYSLYKKGREPLPSMAYFIYTYIKNMLCEGDENTFSKKYAIDKKVLKKMRELSSIKGDYKEARKVAKNNLKPLNFYNTEREWLEEVVKKLIYRVGGFENKPFSQITLTSIKP